MQGEGLDAKESIHATLQSTSITWEQFLDYRRFLIFTENLRKQKEEEENLKRNLSSFLS